MLILAFLALGLDATAHPKDLVDQVLIAFLQQYADIDIKKPIYYNDNYVTYTVKLINILDLDVSFGSDQKYKYNYDDIVTHNKLKYEGYLYLKARTPEGCFSIMYRPYTPKNEQNQEEEKKADN